MIIIPVLLVLAAIAFAIYWFFLRGPSLEPRPAGPDGTARWAYDVAAPRAKTELASDAVPVEMSGDSIFPDGRMAANRGNWQLTFSSFSANQRATITVDHLRNLSVGAKSLPGVIHAIGSPPGTFPDSPTIFAATIGKGTAGARTVLNPVKVEYDMVAGAQVWLIPFRVNNTTETHVVRWDGIWLETR